MLNLNTMERTELLVLYKEKDSDWNVRAKIMEELLDRDDPEAVSLWEEEEDWRARFATAIALSQKCPKEVLGRIIEKEVPIIKELLADKAVE